MKSLSLQTRCPPDPMAQHGGFWFPGYIVEAMEAVALFEPRASDVLLASFPKSGTTWLKALAFAAVHRAEHPPHSPDHPLRHRNPHQCVEFLEFAFAESATTADDVFAALPSPRVLATHLPYSLLPERVTVTAEAGRIVYICRDPKDTLVSMWMFAKKCMAVAGSGTAVEEEDTFTFKEAFELFCQGQCANGPPWHHVAGYWEASQRWPDKVLFLRYEELLQDPVGNVRKLAGFMGRGFSEDEEAAGLLQQIVELCSFHALKNMKVNKSGTVYDLKNESFFRNGVAGDWTNHMTPAMAAMLDKIVHDALGLQGSGFTFRP